MNLNRIRELAATETGLCVVSTTRDDGSVHASVVNAGVLGHPTSGDKIVAFVVRGDAYKLKLLRRRGRVSVTFRRNWSWAGVEGPIELVGPDDPYDGVETRTLLREIFVAAGGTHDDWDEYDRVMAAERRTAVLVTPERTMGS